MHTILASSDVSASSNVSEPLSVQRSIQNESERGSRVVRSPQNSGQAAAQSLSNTMFPGGLITAQGLSQAFHSGIGTSNAQSVSNTFNAIQNGIQYSGSYSMSQSSSSTTG